MPIAEDQIRQLLADYERSLNTSDCERAVDCYAVDGTFMPTTLPTSSGPDLQAAYAQIFANVRLDVAFTIDELVVATDDLAYALTRSNGTQTELATNTETAESNREIFLFGRSERGWKIARYMFNKSE